MTPPEQEYNDRKHDSKASANEELSENSFGINQKTLAPPPLQLKPKKVVQEKEEEKSSTVDEPFKMEISAAEPPPDEKNMAPFQLKESNTSDSGLPNDVQNKMEETHNQDFSKVKYHKDSQKANDIGALAYTQGSDVHFAPGQFQPETTKGQELIGHELTHVVQQSQGRVQPTTQSKGLPVNDDKGLEKEADDMGKKAAQLKSNGKPGQQKADTSMMQTQTIQKWEWPWNWGREKDKKIGKDKGKDKKADPLKTVKLAGSSKGTNFDSTVSIPGPLPTKGTYTAQLNIKLNFLDCNMTNIKKHAVFDKANYKTLDKQIKAAKKADPSSLTWDKKTKAKFQKDYQSSVDKVWNSGSSKLVYKLDEPKYEKYQVANKVKLNFTDKNPHETINTVKMLPAMPRLRSYRGSEDLFDSRDVSVDEKRTQPTNFVAGQIGEFATGSSMITPAIDGKINNFVTKAKKVIDDHKKDTPKRKWNIVSRGRASSPGSKKSNKKLSEKRAENVSSKIRAKIPELGLHLTYGEGETNTDKDTKYQRVEVILQDYTLIDNTQNVAAHETGHMFGLGDEYDDETTDGVLKKSTGDEADDTSDAIRRAGMGEDVVDQHRINANNRSIMNNGSEVMKGHYSFFLIELKKIATDSATGAEVGWQVSKG